MDFFERQHQAKVHTKKLVFYFCLAVLLIIGVLNVIGFFVLNMSPDHQVSPQDWPLSPFSLGITAGTILIIIIGSVLRYWQVRGGGQAVAEMVDGRRIDMDSKDPKERRLINVVEEMSIASGMSVPTIYVMDHEHGMNAFVAGLVPSDTVMVVTAGLLDRLNRQELQGVVAHEFSHIFHSDMRINMRLIGILGGILAIGQLGYYILRSLRYSGGGRSRSRSSGKGNGGQVIIFLIAMSISMIIVGYIGLFFGRLIKAAISRQREYLADAAAVQYSRDSMGIANALYKIKTNGKKSLLDSSHAEDMSHMCFGQSIELTAFSGMLATHPPIDDRIQALVPGYRSIRRQMDEEVVDDLSPIAQFAGSAESVPAADATTAQSAPQAENLVASIGTVQPEQVEEAVEIHKAIPDEIIELAHKPVTVSVLMLALIAANNQADWKAQKVKVKEKVSSEDLEAIEKLLPLAVDARQRIPLVEIAMPAIKRLDEDAGKRLLANTSHLIVADKTISPFEFFLYALLRKHLSEKDAAFDSSTIKSYNKVSDELAELIGMVSLVGNSYDPVKMASLMESFVVNWHADVEPPIYNAKKLHDSLTKLNRLTPLLKKPLMLTLAELVMDDGEVKIAELELLRATGIYLECPVPPLVIKNK